MDINRFIAHLNEQAAADQSGQNRKLDLYCDIGDGALERAARYMQAQGLERVVVTADKNTLQAAGEELCAALEQAGVAYEVCLISEDRNGDVIADEAAVVQAMLAVSEATQAIIAVGSGTIHDIVRFVCYKTGKRFVSIPTAASVDGYASTGAPMIVRRFKQTVPCMAPEAIFADLDILVQAPRRLTAAGFGDMLGKYTSLADWQLSRLLGAEPFSQLAYEVTEQALNACVEKVDEIARGGKQGIAILFDALLRSGLSMMLIGHSRPASGGEHHLSHMWEMECLKEERPQLLHGAKVGVASVLLAQVYRRLALRAEETPALSVYARLPEPEQLASMLKLCGGPSTIAELGISESLAGQALREAHQLRDRYTGLRYIHEAIGPSASEFEGLFG
ncbi:sn-glycerol-1-phosphate dehydrogenase [Paenibacillus sp. y28]|uniref:sn-glycerol-1-phosphate dehydrogenase n=1 Tax=Paenibacillus sp. y28 TaxID=3129110 RepID=UPI00301A5FD6